MKQICPRHMTRNITLGSLLLLFFSVASAWGQPVERLTINYIEASAVQGQGANEVRAYITVSDADDNPVLGLTEQNFEALEDGRQVSVAGASQTTDPMAVVLVIDTSGSMQAQDKSGLTSMEAARMAAMDFISMLSGEDLVAVFSFNNDTFLELDFSNDHAAAKDVIRRLAAKPNAATRLYDSALEAVKKAAEIPKGRRAIIFLTDGKDEKAGHKFSTGSINDVIDAATTKAIRVPIFTIGVGPQVDARELGRMAGLTGGRSLLASSLDELPGFYEAIANQLKNQYLIKYLTRAASGEHSLVVKALYEGSKGQDEKRFWSPPLPVIRPPKVEIVEPESAGLLRNTVAVKLRIDPAENVAKVRYYVDAVLKEEMTTPPYDTFEWNTAALPPGLHILRVEVIDINGQTGTAEITAKVKAPPLPKTKPAPVVQEKRSVKPIMIWVAALVVLLLLIACGVLWWFRLRHKEKTGEALTETRQPRFEIPNIPESYDGDETQFMPDFRDTGDTIVRGEKEGPTPSATIKVIKSMNLDAGKVFEVNIGTTTIGRASANDIFIPDKPVSRKHAEIGFDGKNFYIRDCDSKNGTYVDGENIALESTLLRDAAQIQLSSKTILEFNLIIPEEKIGEDDETNVSEEELWGEDDATKVIED